MTAAARDASKRLLYLVQLPPPVHGPSKMNAWICAHPAINAGLQVSVLRFEFARSLADLNRITPGKLVRYIGLLFKLVARLSRWRPHAVYVTPVPSGPGFLRDAMVLLLIRASGARRIVHLHGRGIGHASQNRFWRLLYALTLRNAVVISLSERQRQLEFAHLQNVPMQHWIVPNTVPESADTERSAPVQPPVANGDRPLALLYMSALFRSKGVYDLLPLAAQLKQEGIAFQLRVAGTGTAAAQTELRDAVAAADLSTEVTLVGEVSGVEKRAELQRAQIFLHPTYDDYQPIVLLEAMAHGIPVVASRIGAISEMVTHGKTGLLFTAGDTRELLSHVKMLYLAPERRRDMGCAGQQRYAQTFSQCALVTRMRQVFAATGLT